MNFISNINQARIPVYFQGSPVSYYSRPSQFQHQHPILSNPYSNSQQVPYSSGTFKDFNNHHQALYSKVNHQIKEYKSHAIPYTGKKAIFYSVQDQFTSPDRKYLNANQRSYNKYNTSEKISQQAEYLQSSTKKRHSSSSQDNSENRIEKKQSKREQNIKFKQERPSQPFPNYLTKPQPIYCVLCQRYYQSQEEKQHLQRHRKVKKSPKKNHPNKQLNQKVSKYQKKIPISIPSEFVITQNVCRMQISKQTKEADVNTSQRDFEISKSIQKQNIIQKSSKLKIRQDSYQDQILIQKQKRYFSNKSAPKNLVNNISLSQIQLKNRNLSQMQHLSLLKKNEQELIQICPSQYEMSDRQKVPQNQRKSINSQCINKQKKQGKISVVNKQEHNLINILQSNNKAIQPDKKVIQSKNKSIQQNYGNKPNLRIPSAKIQKPVYNKSVYQQSLIQIQPTQLNFQDDTSQRCKIIHKSQKNYSKQQNDIIISTGQRKPSSQIKKHPSQHHSEKKQNGQKIKNSQTNQQIEKSILYKEDNNIFKKKDIKYKKKSQQIQRSFSEKNSVDNIQIQSNSSLAQKQKQKNLKINQSSNNQLESNISQKQSKSSKRHVQLIDIGVGDSPVDIQSPGPSNVKSTSSKKQRAGKNMLINEPY